MIKQEYAIKKIQKEQVKNIIDTVAVEQKFTIKTSQGHYFSISCTPQYLEELAVGFLYSEGIIENTGQISQIEVDMEQKEINVSLKETLKEQKSVKPEQSWGERELLVLAGNIFSAQEPLFQETGCAHFCALAVPRGIVCKIEDIGRYNAFNKAVGFALQMKEDLGQAAVFTSGRVSGDYMKKAVQSGIRIVVSRSAVTSEAIEIARKYGAVLYGFVRGEQANLYSL